MFGAVSGELLIEIAKANGCYTQLELDLGCPPFYFIKPELICEVPDVLNYYSPTGSRYGTLSFTNHPSFEKMRNHLEQRGFIKVERSWCNGDRVLKKFFLNNFLMLPGDKFLSAAAMHNRKEWIKYYNGGEIDTSVKNYREEDSFYW